MPIKKVYRPTIRKDGAGYIIEVAAETTDSSDSLTGGLIYIAAFRGGTLGIETTRLSPGTVNRNEEWAIQAGAQSLTESQVIITELRACLRDTVAALRAHVNIKDQGPTTTDILLRARRALGGA